MVEREVNNLSEETEPGVTVIEEDDGSADRQKLLALLTSRYLLKFEEEEILYLSASLAVVKEKLDEWGRGGGGKVQTASLHHCFPDHTEGFPESSWTGDSVSRVKRTIILPLGRGIPRWTESRRCRRRGVLT